MVSSIIVAGEITASLFFFLLPFDVETGEAATGVDFDNDVCFADRVVGVFSVLAVISNYKAVVLTGFQMS